MVNVTPRYAKLKARADQREVIGWENIELISDRPFETMLEEFARLKEEFPGRILIASIMEARGPLSFAAISCSSILNLFDQHRSCEHHVPIGDWCLTASIKELRG